jgi:hypothetical protein
VSATLDFRNAKTEAEAVAIFKSWLIVSTQQIAFYRRESKLAFDGGYVDHVRREAEAALAFLEIATVSERGLPS